VKADTAQKPLACQVEVANARESERGNHGSGQGRNMPTDEPVGGLPAWLALFTKRAASPL
jgi:hypothetical protein